MTAPIKRSPSCPLLRPTTPSLPEIDEAIPFPYSYTMIMVNPEEQATVRAKFMQECNYRRWQHIYNAQTQQKSG